MAYCGQATQANADYLASKTGMDPRVALAWLRNECQSVANPTNPLNIRYYGSSGQVGSKGGFGVYTSTHAGLDAAARLINGSAYYSGIRAAIKTKNPAAEAHAIELSPWAAGHYGGSSSKYGGISRVLNQIMHGTLPPLPKGTTVSAPGPATVTTLADLLKLNPNDTLNPGNSGNIIKAITALEGAGTLPHAETQRLLNYIGSLLVAEAHGMKPPTLGSIKVDTATGGAPSILPDIPGAIGAFGDMIGKLAGFMAGLFLIALGVFLYGKSVRSKVETIGPSPSPSLGRVPL